MLMKKTPNLVGSWRRDSWTLTRLAADDVLFRYGRHRDVEWVHTGRYWKYWAAGEDISQSSALYVVVRAGNHGMVAATSKR